MGVVLGGAGRAARAHSPSWQLRLSLETEQAEESGVFHRARVEGRTGRRIGLALAVTGLLIAGVFIAVTAAGAAGPAGPSAWVAGPAAPSADTATATALPSTGGQESGVLAAAISRDPSLAHDGDGIATVELADVSSSNVAVRQVKAAILAPAPAGVKAIRAAPG